MMLVESIIVIQGHCFIWQLPSQLHLDHCRWWQAL
jgi:hypothetical protein